MEVRSERYKATSEQQHPAFLEKRRVGLLGLSIVGVAFLPKRP
jgi:hypothetical protein